MDKFKLTEGRYCHDDGHAILVYTPDGKDVLTGGADGDVRRYIGGHNAEDVPSFLVADEILALAINKTKIFTSGNGMNKVLFYDVNNPEEETTLMRFQADVTCLDCTDTHLAAGSEDMTVKVIELESNQEMIFKGHEAPILDVAMDKRKEFVVSTSCDGSIKLWRLSSESCVQTIDNQAIVKSNEFKSSPTMAKVYWESFNDSEKFMVAQNKKLGIYNRSGKSVVEIDVEKINDIEFKSKEYFSVCDWSPNSEFVCAGTNQGQFFVFNLDNCSLVLSKSIDKAFKDMRWNPKRPNEFSFVDDAGYWYQVSDIKFPTIKLGKVPQENSSCDNKNTENLNEEELAGLFDDDDDDENSFSIKKIKAATGFEEEEDGETKFVAPKLTDMEENKVNEALKLLNDDEIERKTSLITAKPPKLDIQPPFQSGATPVHLSSRFMVWNSVGIVKSFNSEDESSIDVEFHDTSTHHPLHLSNVVGHTMADLSKVAIVMASEAEGDDPDDEDNYVKSKLSVHYFGSSDLNKDWSIEMPSDEDILAICIGDNWVAAATDKRNLRLFSLSGMQLQVLSLPGPILTLSGNANNLMIIIHAGMPLPGDQCLAVAILDVNTKPNHKLANFMSLPLAPKSHLSWTGFSDEGTPCIMDNAGIIKLFNKSFNQWYQICDTNKLAKGKSDNYFMVGVSEKNDTLRAILCRGSKYPFTVPKPIISIFSLQLNLCEHGTEKTTLEESYWKANLLISDEDKEGEANQMLIKLFALAVKGDCETRAYEICKLMDSSTIQIAIRYASKLRKITLANKLNELARQQLEKEEEEEENEAVAAENRHHHQLQQQRTYSIASSQRDIFDSQEYEEDIDMNYDKEEEEKPVNPLLAAKLGNNPPIKSIKDSQSQDDLRNPFKKNFNKNTPTTSSSSNRSGIVFDNMSSASLEKKNNKSGQFGNRSLDLSSSFSKKNSGNQKKLFTIRKDKENKTNNGVSSSESNNDADKTPLKGFQLWLAENQHSIESDDVQTEGLKQWKSLSKDEKEGYKTPRIPSSKRKRENNLDSTADTPPTKLKSKFAAFAPPSD